MTIIRIVSLFYRTVPGLTIINSVFSVLNSLAWAVTIIVTKNLFDAVVNVASGHFTFRDCVPSLLILAGVIIGREIFNGVNFFFIFTIYDIAVGKIKTMLQRKIQRIDPVNFENTSFLDDLNKGSEGVFVIPYFCSVFYATFSFFLVYFASIGTFLYSLKPILVIIIPISFIPAMLGLIVRSRVFTELEQQSAPLRREYDYYKKTICDREYFKETRILGSFKFFHKLFTDTLLLLTRKVWQAERKVALLQLLLNVTTLAGLVVSVYLLFTATMTGEISLGAFAAVFSSLTVLFNIMQDWIVNMIGNMTRDFGKVSNFLRVMDSPERSGADGETDFAKGIVTENISFTYPGRDEPAVDDVSLTIQNGETIAIVGENGAGKSTLVRLLTGIYLPSKGKVTVGGLDTAKSTPASVYKGISGVFQKYQRYKMTLRDNVNISSAKDETHSGDSDNSRIENALSEADAVFSDDVNLDTMLSPEFDGIDLSGGQWQRVAIARGLYRQNHFIVLDEPTSAIDPIEETRIYTKFQHLAEGKCAIIVTHRLGSAKLAKRIIVMDGGSIVDSGTHDELLSRPGKYAEMWAAQSQWYERE